MTDLILAEKISEFVHEKAYEMERGAGSTVHSGAVWNELRNLGTRLWLDTGDIEQAAHLWNSNFSGLTTNNTLLNREIQKGGYDQVIVDAARLIKEVAPGFDLSRIVFEIAFILNALHGLRLVKHFNCHVSVELHTGLACNIGKSFIYGRRLNAICPDRFFVKVPLTTYGLIAAGRLQRAGIPVNLTLGFSARQNYLAAAVTNPSFVNVFMGRLNAFVADNKLGSGVNVGEKATLATQRNILELRKSGISESLLIGASMRSGGQIFELAGVDVMTLPVKVAAEFEKLSEKIEKHIENNPDIDVSENFMKTLWNVPEGFKAAVKTLAMENFDMLTPELLVERLAEAGFADLFPEWLPDEISTASVDGKIPDFNSWKKKLKNRTIGLDALMNLSALESFKSDQKALDNRIEMVVREYL
ncbi:transaldolase family protein [Lentisphaerota bacterium ZTH]|nr:transaldolase [Lentisphaerota bacterium]WET07120.1 transaldolase family protein [Lentisphaerota bacterium ZTH]